MARTRTPKKLFRFNSSRHNKSDEWLMSHKPGLIEHAKERETKARQKLNEMKQLMKGVENEE